jgi:uncharacterized damage-inducible protein DinB
MSTMLREVRKSHPDPAEHAPYYGKYIALVPDGDIVGLLRSQIDSTTDLLRGVPGDREQYRYAEGKWSVREVIGHLSDAERIFTYRALRFARADRTPLHGFDENAYAATATYHERRLSSVAEEFAAVRAASVAFFDALTDEEWQRRGPANAQEVSVRALAWIIAGHERHHVGLLRERYGV